MATLVPQDATAGLGEVVWEDADAEGDEVPSGVLVGGWKLPVVLLARNSGAGIDPTHEVTVDGLAAVEVPPEGAVAVIPVARAGYGQLVDVEYSAVTDLEVAAVRLTGVVA